MKTSLSILPIWNEANHREKSNHLLIQAASIQWTKWKERSSRGQERRRRVSGSVNWTSAILTIANREMLRMLLRANIKLYYLHDLSHHIQRSFLRFMLEEDFGKSKASKVFVI